MKKNFKIKDLDCACCAAKMEERLKNLPDVNSCHINFLTQRLTIEIEDSRFEEVMLQVEKEIKKVEPDCSILR